MAVFRPFRAFRPATKNQRLIPALPYDVMSSQEARKIVQGNPLSFLHIDRAEIDFPVGTDQYSRQVYEKARDNLLKLEENGDLIQDDSPCLYIYRQIMNGRMQTGIVGCASIDDYKNNVIKKHEHTLAKKEQDRINHVNICDANTGPIFLTYRKREDIEELVSAWVSSHEPVYDFDFDSVRQTVWVIDDVALSNKLQTLFYNVESLYIADGHHRCASAVKVGEIRREEKGNYTGEEEFNFFLAVAFNDEDLEIMDYNRVVRDLNGYTFDEFVNALSDKFEVSELDSRRHPKEKHSFCMYYDGKWYLLKAKEGTFDETDPVARLDVSILQNNLLAPILNITNPKNDDRIDFIGGIRGLEELERRANTDMKIAFAMYPTTVDDLMSIADAGKIMPPKSTWFEPKLLSGLFIHHLK
ncbi:DUF1015 domain-containing protein [uncultured Eubacterium sp.]|uniref:DUF1015 domain-containing protein n=1 Tax=uncultured Eubacterium sp. TaxID=165185 RepID=UPI0015ABDEC8|nr:DUF1015 family protein [uncultured Eubacterium sp.]